ncbi:uncharacterized protein LAESUDRAFT_816417 [Laetiporus sulphureus 93-53]|uniref:Hemopexin n=1 Tax=Laetiporus sulphureus 93-53 TaxID=1314785 RepID=A0A165BBG2_9APHY|nr:uncharacterized protein LAESUDRAFT_816417 [Laetiporus sulphureus 93-53]KZT00675.1 hypothetical protein LAESUDRAFT_816417 [Laetiporus sulphureus 93-53]
MNLNTIVHDGFRHEAVEDTDLMHGDGEEVEDDIFDVDPVPRVSVASILQPSDPKHAYFFCANRYVLINVAPASTFDSIISGPRAIVEGWPYLINSGFGSVDSVLAIPGKPGQMYFFCGKRYVRIYIESVETTSGHVVEGPADIAARWPSLRRAGFETIDAILSNPAKNEEAYFFSGEQYALIDIESNTNADSIVNGPKAIRDDWPSLSQAGFKTVDTALPNPANFDEAYFFSGEQYVLINVRHGITRDYVVNGPNPIRDDWPSLHQAGFW